MMSKLWTWFLNSRLRINSLTGFVFLVHTFSYSVSPMIKELVELDRQKENSNNKLSGLSIPYSLAETYQDYKDDDSVRHYLKRPLELVKLIKRYHGVGNIFFVIAFLHASLLTYLGSKAFFQVLVIGDDKELAKYYSSIWYPRLLDNYPNPESFYNLCLMYLAYYVSFRYLCIYRLVTNAVLNRNGYKHITVSQANFSIAGLYNWSMREWVLYIKTAYKHAHLCATDENVKKAHLCFDTVDNEKLCRYSRRELIYYNNPIDFTRCYGEMTGAHAHPNNWAKKWYTPKYNCRHDLTDSSRFFTLHLSGAAILLALVPIVCLVTLIFDMSKLLPDPERATIYEIIAVFPEFITNPSAVIKYLDVLCAILVQFPNHIEAGRIYWDVLVMVSRTRKVYEALTEDLNFCVNRSNEYKRINFRNYDSLDFAFDNIKGTEKAALNKSIDLHVRLVQVLNIEFMDLKREHTLYLNLLFVGNGLCISVCISLILSAQSFIVTILMGGLALSCFFPIVAIIVCCIKCELDVSTFCFIPDIGHQRKRIAKKFPFMNAVQKFAQVDEQAACQRRNLYRAYGHQLYYDNRQSIRADQRQILPNCRPVPDNTRNSGPGK